MKLSKMIKIFIFFNLINFLFLNSLFAKQNNIIENNSKIQTKADSFSEYESSEFVSDTTISILNGFNQALDQSFQEILVLIVPNENGDFFLDSLYQYQKAFKENNLNFKNKNLTQILEQVFQKKKKYKNLILRIRSDVTYGYLYKNYISKIDDYLIANYTDEELSINFKYVLYEPFIKE